MQDSLREDQRASTPLSSMRSLRMQRVFEQASERQPCVRYLFPQAKEHERREAQEKTSRSDEKLHQKPFRKYQKRRQRNHRPQTQKGGCPRSFNAVEWRPSIAARRPRSAAQIGGEQQEQSAGESLAVGGISPQKTTGKNTPPTAAERHSNEAEQPSKRHRTQREHAHRSREPTHPHPKAEGGTRSKRIIHATPELRASKAKRSE